MITSTLDMEQTSNKLELRFCGELNVYKIAQYIEDINRLNFDATSLVINLENVTSFDTSAALFIQGLQKKSSSCIFHIRDKKIEDNLKLVKNKSLTVVINNEKTDNFLENIGKKTEEIFISFTLFMEFFGKVFLSGFAYVKNVKNVKNIRHREIAFEINESAIKALGIISLTSFLIGVVIAYQSADQLKIYGANIFIVDMLGISMLRELAPLITAIVIAGRSGSAFTAQIGAMKITQELDAMETMGFDPYTFLVMPRIIALMITLPILIFVADIMGVLGGMLIAFIDLGITNHLFLERFTEVVAVKHFFIGIGKGVFFAFLIASIGIFRGLQVKDNTQSIGFNTTKSVVESIFAVIVCDALFSVALTTLGF